MTSISIQSPSRLEPALSDALASWRAAWQRHAYILPSFLIVMFVCAWMATWGDWRLFEKEVFCGFYDAQARSLLHGHLDVPPSAIGFEAFIFRGKTYGYFGIGPALLRLPLVVLFKNMDGRWSRSLLLIACVINLSCAYRILLWMRGTDCTRTTIDRVLNSLFILCAGIGSTNIFIVDRCYTYHEAIMWGATFALLFTVTLLKYFRSPDGRLLAVAGVFAFFSFNARPTAGAGVLLALCIVAVVLFLRAISRKPVAQTMIGLSPVDRPMRHALIAGGAALLIVGTYFAVNYGKFRTLDGVPVRYYGMYQINPIRMQNTGGRQIHPENLPTGIATYFGLRGAQFKHAFPWIYLSRQPTVVGTPAIDIVEQYSSIPVSMPALALLALLGLGFIVRGKSEISRNVRLPVFGLLVGGSIMLMSVGITERYLHDLYPFLIVAGAAGLARVGAGKNPRRMTQILAVLAVVSIGLNCMFALEYQRLAVWGVAPEKHREFQHMQHSVDRFLHIDSAEAEEG